MTTTSAGAAVDDALAEYLQWRVATLAAIAGNPYGAAVRSEGGLSAFLVRDNPSPMFNRICGDVLGDPQALAGLVDWFARHGCPATVAVTHRQAAPAEIEVGDLRLRRLPGWSHQQFLGPTSGAPAAATSELRMDPLGSGNFDEFCRIYSDGFRFPSSQLPLLKAAYAGLLTGTRAQGFIASIEGRAAGVGMVYYAQAGVAYLGTAATRKPERGLGCHRALIAQRIRRAGELGLPRVAASASAGSQSSRNLMAHGLRPVAQQTLYGLCA